MQTPALALPRRSHLGAATQVVETARGTCHPALRIGFAATVRRPAPVMAAAGGTRAARR